MKLKKVVTLLSVGVLCVAATSGIAANKQHQHKQHHGAKHHHKHGKKHHHQHGKKHHHKHHAQHHHYKQVNNVSWLGMTFLTTGFYMPEHRYSVNYAHTKWVHASNGEVPYNAVITGRHGLENSYTCAVKYKGQMHKGWLYNNQGCFVKVNGKVYESKHYGVLVHS